MSQAEFNVRRFGAKGNGKSDDTKAIQRALDETSAAVLTRKDTESIPYPDGIPARCGYHFHSTGPELFFPSGHYVISAPLLPRKTLALRGEGHPWIEQKDVKQDIIYCEDSIRQTFVGLAFHGGRNHLNLGNSNEDNGIVRIEDCKFYGSKGTAIQMRENSNSTQLLVLRCQIVGCEQAVVSWTDLTHIREGWIAGGCSGDGAQIVSRDEAFLTLENLCLVPMVNGYDQRWIDNHGNVICRNVRFGGEEGGFTPIVNFTKYQPLLLGYMVVLDSCWMVCGLGNAKRPCAVYCEEIPNMIEIRNCNLAGIAPVMVSEKIDPKTYFQVNPGMVSYRFEGNTGDRADQIPAMLKKPRLTPPPGPKVMTDAETRTALARAKQDWSKRRAQAKAVAPGEFQGHKQQTRPGTFKEIPLEPGKWDLNDWMDGTIVKNSRFFALSPVPGGMLVLRKAYGEGGSWPHILVHDVTIDLDQYPYLTWRLCPTGSPVQLSVRIVEKDSGRNMLLEESQSGHGWGYRAQNLRELLKKGGKRTIDLKLYYQGTEFVHGTRRKEDRRFAKAGDYMVIEFLRAEK